MHTFNRKILISIAHAHFEKNLHSAPVRGRLKPYILCTVTKSIVCNTCGITFPTRVKFAIRAVVVLSLARLGYASARLDYGSCYTLHTLIWNRAYPTLIQYMYYGTLENFGTNWEHCLSIPPYLNIFSTIFIEPLQQYVYSINGNFSIHDMLN